MPTIGSVFDTAKTALLTAQRAISVTSHNIANANTEGYTRQRAVLETMDPLLYGGLHYGTGVDMAAIERVYDSFQTIQLRNAESALNRYDSKGTHLYALEAIINDFNSAGLSTRIDEFFNSVQDVATSPSSYGERADLISNATVLADSFNSIDSRIRQNISGIHSSIQSKVDEMNSLASRIADLNGQIAKVEIGRTSANDLRDKRDLLIEELAKFADVSVTENATGQVDVYVGGSFIVAGTKPSEISVTNDPNDPDGRNLVLNGGTINGRITGGSILGDLEGLAHYKDTLDRVNLLAASLTKEVNLQHRQGYGLDGSTGADFFSIMPVYAGASSANTGGAVISGGTVSDLSLLTLDDYEVRFSTPGAYTIVNTTDDTVVANGAYTSGAAISFEGLTVTITDSPKPPAAGDRFTISPTRTAAQAFSVAIDDPSVIAASATAAGVPGDNANALALAALQDAATLDSTSFGQYYNRIITDLGTAARDARVNHQAQDKFTEELRVAKESVSGVSIEEEAVNLVKLQRAYEAAAQVMKTADEMFSTLLSIR